MQVRRCELPEAQGIISACLTKDGKFLYVLTLRKLSGDRGFGLLEIDTAAGTVLRGIGGILPRPASLRLSTDDGFLAINELGDDKADRLLIWDRRKEQTILRELCSRQQCAAFFPEQ